MTTLENPVTGERFTFTDTSATTDGELLAFELALRPGGGVPRYGAVRCRHLTAGGTVRPACGGISPSGGRSEPIAACERGSGW